MESVDEALIINDDNVIALLDTTDLASAEGMFELYIQYKGGGRPNESS